MKYIAIIVSAIMISGPICAATYYVAPNGNDAAGSGTILSPWKTITYGQSKLLPGDTLLVRGGTYYESVTLTAQGTQNNPVTIKAYPGETPVLDGRTIVTGWTRCAPNEPGLTVAGKTNIHASNIYKTDINTSGFIGTGLWWMLYEDGNHSFLCRWPEQSEGYGLDPKEFQQLASESIGKSASIRDDTFLNPSNPNSVWYPYINELSSQQLAGYWNGAYAQVWFKSGANATESYRITAYSNNEISTGTLRRALLYDDRYCIYRHPHLLNAPGKFYFSPQAVNGYQTFYFWPQNAANLNGKISVPTKSKGFYASNKNYVTIDGFRIVGFKEMGIHFIHSTNISPVIKNCTVEDCGNTGIYIQNTTGAVVDNCIVNRVGDRGIFINDGKNCVIKNSVAKDNRGTCISMYTVENGQITDNTIYSARGVHVNGLSCYLGCKKVLIARNKFSPGVNLAMQNISDVCLFANILDGGGEKTNLISTWVDTTNSDYATRGYQVYLNNTLINSASPYSMISFRTRSGSFEDATIDNNGGRVRLNAPGRFTSTQFKYTGTYGLMIYCDFSNNNLYADGWYESTANTADTCTIKLNYVSGTQPTASGQCGGQSDNYLYNNLIGGCSQWDTNMLGRSHNWWIPYTYGSSFSIPKPPVTGEIYTSYSNRTSALNSCFTDWANQNYTLKTDSAAIGAGMSLAAINALLDDPTIGDSGTSIRQNFPDFDFSKDIAGNPWNSIPSMGAYEYGSGDPNPTSYTLTVAATNGSVTKRVNGIITTATSFAHGTVVTLTAVANTGYTFSGWTGSAAGTANPVSVTMDGNKSVTANFTQNTTPTYTLSITAANGSVTKRVNGVVTTDTSFAHGTVVTLTAVANTGYSFSGWTGSAAGTANPVSVTMDGNKSVTANFTQDTTPTYTLSITAANGSVTKRVNGVVTTETSFAHGTVVTLTAAANTGYTFSGWTGSAAGTANPVSVTMDGNKSVIASFTQTSPDIIIDNRDVTVASVGTWLVSGGTNPYGSDSVYARNPNLSFSWLFTPAESGYYDVFMWWTEFSSRSDSASVDIEHAGGTASTTVNQLANGGTWNLLGQCYFNAGITYRVTIYTKTDNTTISADAVRFTKTQNIATYNLSVTAANGSVSKSPDKAAYTNGETVVLTATPAAGYTFAGWSGSVTGMANPVTITMDGNKSVTANFTQNTYTLTTAAVNGSVTKRINGAVTTATSFTYGTVVQLTAAANSGYLFSNWSGSVSGTANPVSLVMTGNRSVTANFTEIALEPASHWLFNEPYQSKVLDIVEEWMADLIGNPHWGEGWAEEYYVRLDTGRQAVQVPMSQCRPDAGTVALWIQPENSELMQVLFGHEISNAGNRIALYLAAGNLAVHIGDALHSNIMTLTPGRTYHIVLTWNGTDYAVFVDGVHKAAGTFAGLTQLNAFADVGNYGNPNNRESGLGFRGLVEDVQLYSRSLNADEIQVLLLTYHVKENRSIEFVVSGTDDLGNPLSYTASNLPEGANFDVATQTFFWRPALYNAAGRYSIRFSAAGQPDQTVTVFVQNVALSDWYKDFLERIGKH